MPPRALAVLLVCAAVLASAVVAGAHVLGTLVPVSDATAAPAVAAEPETGGSPSAAGPALPQSGTRRVDLAPVDAAGSPAAGWTVTDGEGGMTVECGYASPAAVSPGIQTCSPTAAGADVCWPTPEGFVACLTDPWSRELLQYPATDVAETVSPPPDPSPVGLELADGTHCRLRNGGAWPGRDADPDMFGAYSCSDDGNLIVWSDRDPDLPIDQSAPVWTVRIGTPTGTLRTLPVAVAYFAATA